MGPSSKTIGPVFALAPLKPLIVTMVPFGPDKTVLALKVTVIVFVAQGKVVDCPILLIQKKGA